MNCKRIAMLLSNRVIMPQLLAFLCLFLSCCTGSDNKEIVLQREWIANAEFAGDLMASKIASQEGWSLHVEEGSEVKDPVHEVRTGRAHFGVASADRILKENELGAGLVIVAVASPKSPVVFLGRKNIQLDTPSAFLGRYVGIQSGTNTEVIFDALVAVNGLDRKSIKVVESGWGVGEFVSGQVEILAAFDYDEPIQLEKRGVDFNPLYPVKHGVDFIGTVYFSRKDLVLEDPEVVKKFLNVLVRGWEATFSAQNEALELLHERYKSLDIDKETLSLAAAEPYFRGDNGILLYADRSRWEKMGEVLVKMRYLKEFDFDHNIDYSFLRAAVRSHDRANP